MTTVVSWAGSRTNSYYLSVERNKFEGAPLWEIAVQASGRVWVGFARFNGAEDPALDNIPAKFDIHCFKNPVISDDGGATSPSFWTRLGFSYDHNMGAGRENSFIGLPWWFVGTATSILPAMWLVHHRLRRRRFVHGRCSTCSYDLAFNTSGTCPECGAACKAADPAGVSRRASGARMRP